MFDLNLMMGLAIGALVAAVVVLGVMASGRRAFAQQLASAQSAQAVAESRISDLTAKTTQLETANQRLATDNLRLATERERLSTTLEKASQDLAWETVAATGLREQVEENVRLHSRLESDHRVTISQNRTLTERLAELEAAVQKADVENRQHTHDLAQLKAQSAALEEKRQGLETRLAEQKAWVEEQTRFFEQKIAGVATQLLDEKSRAFTEVNKKEIDAVVAPFKEQLKEFRERVDHIYVADSRERGQLHEQIRQLTELNQLREGKEYMLQHTVEGAEEDLQRPDAVILLPDGKHVVLDSKVSNKAWKEYCAATDEETREAKLGEHLASVRAHMRELSSRDYQHSPDLKTIEFVLMFVPIEAALLTALSRDDSLFTEAWRAKVYLVSPGMLMASLKLIEGMWVYQRRKESADKIAEAGRKLYDKLTIFSNTFVDVGVAIEKAHGTFERAKGQLSTGKGNAIRLAQRMIELGVGPGPGKVMAPELVALADGEDDDAEVTALPTADGIEEQRSSGDAG